MTLVPVDAIPVPDLVSQLSQGQYPEWCHFKGQHIGEVEVGNLLFTDGDFMVFWMTRLWETEAAFERIVESNPQGWAGSWSRARLLRAQEHVAYYTRDVEGR